MRQLIDIFKQIIFMWEAVLGSGTELRPDLIKNKIKKTNEEKWFVWHTTCVGLAAEGNEWDNKKF